MSETSRNYRKLLMILIYRLRKCTISTPKWQRKRRQRRQRRRRLRNERPRSADDSLFKSHQHYDGGFLCYYNSAMAHEIETKVLDIDVGDVLQKMANIKAKMVSKTRLSVSWFRIKGVKEGEDPWFLRIRSNSEGKNEVTWKAKSDILGTARKHKEINFNIAEPEKLEDLFIELGLEKYAYQEKDRTTFVLNDWQFDLDQYPRMPAFLEIEGKSEEHVKEAMSLLGIEKNKTWAKGERILIQDTYKLDWYDMKF